MRKRLRSEQGFTLVEMVVVIALVAILAAIAMPIYSNYTKAGKAAEAGSVLGALVTAANVSYQNNNTYANFNTANDPASQAAWNAAIAQARYFDYSISTAGDANGITLKANAKAILVNGKTNPLTQNTDYLTVQIQASNPTIWKPYGACSVPAEYQS